MSFKTKAFELFCRIDTDGNGKISLDEFMEYFSANSKSKESFLINVGRFVNADTRLKGYITFKEFYELYLITTDTSKAMGSYIGLFCLFDEGKKGYLTFEEMLLNKPANVSEEEFKNQLKTLDASGDGKIQLEEYLIWKISSLIQTPEDKKKIYEEWFNKEDNDNDGKISFEEFKKIYNENVQGADKIEDIDKEILFRAFSDLNDGFISLGRYQLVMSAEIDKQEEIYYKAGLPLIKLLGEYKLMDKENKGKVSLDECAKFIAKIHEDDEDEVISEFMECIDRNGNGTVELNEYLLFFINGKDASIKEKNSKITYATLKLKYVKNSPPKTTWYLYVEYNDLNGNLIRKKSRLYKNTRSYYDVNDFALTIPYEGKLGNKNFNFQKLNIQIKEFSRFFKDNVIANVEIRKEMISESDFISFRVEGDLTPKYNKKPYCDPVLGFEPKIDN